MGCLSLGLTRGQHGELGVREAVDCSQQRIFVARLPTMTELSDAAVVHLGATLGRSHKQKHRMSANTVDELDWSRA